jgi:F-type H+-transporting ATPase subunit epsilon
MADPISFELVSPERLLLSADVDMVVVPGAEGDFGVLNGHAPLISALRPGVIDTYAGNNVDKRIFVAGGFAEVTGERCTVLAEEALMLSDIDRTKAEARIAEAREAIADATTDLARAAAEARLAVGEAMLQAVSA